MVPACHRSRVQTRRWRVMIALRTPALPVQSVDHVRARRHAWFETSGPKKLFSYRMNWLLRSGRRCSSISAEFLRPNSPAARVFKRYTRPARVA
jgi:hypothetical protein